MRAKVYSDAIFTSVYIVTTVTSATAIDVLKAAGVDGTMGLAIAPKCVDQSS